MADLADWTPRPRPEPIVLDGRYARLEPLDAQRHGDGLYAASSVPDAAERFTWLGTYPPENRSAFAPWLDYAQASADPMYFTVIDRAADTIVGRQALMRIDPAAGVAEIGDIYWGPRMSRTPTATEALFLVAAHVFDDLGYRRFEWKCNDRNEPSKRAARRFGFTYEGLFRQHMVVKGENRDTAWFSIIDAEWPALRAAFRAWLSPENFDTDGRQRRRLEEIR